MNKTILCFLLPLFMAAGSVYAQNKIKPVFISIKNKYEFTLPQFGVSLPLPAHAQFQVPEVSGKYTHLEIDDVTCYYFDTKHLKEPNTFTLLFTIASQKAEELLLMNVLKKGESYLAQLISETISDGRNNRTGIKTKLGESFLYDESKNFETHIIAKDEYYFVFRLHKTMDKTLKEKYLNIIKGFKEKQQHYLRTRHETRVANGGYYSSSTKKRSLTVEETKEKGVLSDDMLFEWPDLGYSIRIPQGWEYKVSGTLAPQERDHTVLLFDKAFMESNFMTISWFNNDEMSVTLRSYRETDPMDMISHYIKSTKHTQTINLVIDGLPLKGYFFGSKEYGSLDFCFKAQDAYHWISFSSVSNKTAALVQELLSTIKLGGIQEAAKQATTTVPNIEAQLKLKHLSPIELDEPLPLTDDWPTEKLFNCKLVDLGIHTKLPGMENDYMCTIGSSKGYIDNGVVNGVPLNDTDKRLSIFSLKGAPISFSISKKAPIASNEQYIRNMKRGWSVYKNMEIVYGSIVDVNELEWRVCISRNGSHYFVMSSADVDDLEISVYINAASKEEALESVSYLKNVIYR